MFNMISGATYSGVPQKVHVFRSYPIFLAKPKSTFGPKQTLEFRFVTLSVKHLEKQL